MARKQQELKVRRVFVSREGLLRGERIEKKEEDFTPGEMTEWKRKTLDTYITNLGYVKITETENDTA